MTNQLDKSIEGVIKAWFDYNPETGEISWKEWVSPDWYKLKGAYNNYMNDRAGTTVTFGKKSSGHLYTGAGGINRIYAHRIAWVISQGSLPIHYIDHIDGNPENNKIENLRDVTHKINHRNRKMRPDNTSGYTGVTLDKRLGKWRANVHINGRYKYLGCYEKIEDAVDARKRFLSDHPELGFTNRHGEE